MVEIKEAGALAIKEVYGTRQFILCKKLKALKYALKILNRREFSHISEQAAAARIKLEEAHQRWHDSPLDASLVQMADRAKTQVLFLDKAEKSFYYQKAKCLSIRDGDRSTKFFQSLSKWNAKRNYIAFIAKQDGSLTTSSTEVLDEFGHYYRDLLGTRVSSSPLDISVLDYGPCLSEEASVWMCRK